MPAVEMLKLLAQNMAYAGEYHVWSHVYITRSEETNRGVSTGLQN